MASHGSDEWLQLSLGSGIKSEESQPEEIEDQPADQVSQSPTQSIIPTTSTDLSGRSIRDFFKFGSETEVYHGRTYMSPILPRHWQHYSGTSKSSHRSVGLLLRPLTFLEPRRQSSRDSPRVDPIVNIPPVPSGGSIGNVEGQFLSPSPVLQQRPVAFSNLTTLQHHASRVFQSVRSEQTETTSVHASLWMGVHHPHHEAPRTPPNPAELIGMVTPGAFRDRRSGSASSQGPFLTMQPPMVQRADPEQAWRNLIQQVGSDVDVSSGFEGAGVSSSSGHGDDTMLPAGERAEYLGALARAVERFQGSDQGGQGEPLTELHHLHKNAMFPSGQRPHLGPFDPRLNVSLARYSDTPLRGGSKARASAPALALPSDRQRRILRPYAPSPGLWFTLHASYFQPEASPLQQIPVAYIRVVDENMTVAAVRRYLVNKLGLASEDEVELTCKGQPLQSSILLFQVRDGIWKCPNTSSSSPSTRHLMTEGKAWKAPDGSITLVGDAVMVLTYGRRLLTPPTTSS